MTTPIRVGVLFVQGIGEQHKFQELEDVARNIATALDSDESLRVRVTVNSTDSGAYGASQQTWLADDNQEPVIIEVTDKKTKDVTHLAFREVWWSDLDEPVSLKTQLAFWGWGLSLWSRGKYTHPNYATSNKMREPQKPNSKTPKISLTDRLRFFWVSLVVLLIMPLLSLLSVILRQVLGFKLRPDILIQYLGDVKLYQQGERVGKGPLVDLGQPPRVSIRRRMVKGLVQMSLSDYDRWYILSHSLGTLIAFNGLMETDAALANYLDKELWDQWQQFSNKKAKEEDKLTPDQAHNMLPSRPAWLKPEDIVDRSDLFKKLKGVMTYGSPLSKFAVFWPAIVPINKDTDVFSPDFEWINVYDPNDPVADQTKYFQFTTPNKKQQPTEIAYKAESLHLVSHGEYLTFNQKRQHPLVKKVADWLLTGDEFKPAPTSAGWSTPNGTLARVYVFIRILIWLVLGFLIALILSWLVPFSLPNGLEKIISETTHLNLSNPSLYVVIATDIVIIVGIVVRLFSKGASLPSATSLLPSATSLLTSAISLLTSAISLLTSAISLLPSATSLLRSETVFYFLDLTEEETTAPKKPATKKRQFYCWLEPEELPLQVDKDYKFWVNIGTPNQQALTSREFPEPDWGDRKDLDLLIRLSSLEVDIKPALHTVKLDKQEDMSPVFFQIIPRKVGSIILYLSVFLEPELALIEDYSLDLEAVKNTSKFLV